METLIRGLESAFAYFGGVPQELLFDQMRSVVISDDRLSERGLVLNTEFLRFAAHWGFRPRACRAYRAKTNTIAERSIGKRDFAGLKTCSRRSKPSTVLYVYVSESFIANGRSCETCSQSPCVCAHEFAEATAARNGAIKIAFIDGNGH